MYIVSTKTYAIQGVIDAPASKSEAIRALVFALQSPGTSLIHHMLDADDVTDTIHVCQALGARIERHGSSLALTSHGAPFSPAQTNLYTGNSGLATRLLLPMMGLCAQASAPMTLDCGMQMRARPMTGLINVLNQLGMNINSSQWPLEVTGTLRGGHATLDEPISQFLSSLLMSLPLAEQNSTIIAPLIPAWSYVEMTLHWLQRLGIHFSHQQNNNAHVFSILGKQKFKAFEYTLPGDFSSASYFIAAASILPGSVRIKGLDLNASQGDKQLIDIIQHMGGDISFDGLDIVITGGTQLNGMRIDASNIPDLVPTLAVLGTIASGKTEIRNVSQARLKETDRIHSMTEGLTRLGANIEEHEDGMTIHSSRLNGTRVKGYQDHRTVMALSLAGLMAHGETIVEDAESIQKTFPEFVTHMKTLGVNMEIMS